MSALKMYRGDSFTRTYTLKDAATGLPVDITGWNIVMTVSIKKNPVAGTDTPVFTVAAVLAGDPTTGIFTITPTAANTDLAPSTYYYDIQATVGTDVITLILNTFEIEQDISK